jgi:MFS family permease
MAGGFLGYASGGAVSTLLVSNFGFQGLYPFIIISMVSIALVIILKVRLAIEPKKSNESEIQTTDAIRLPFWFIFVMAMPAAVSMTILAMLLPTALNELGYELTFGGYSTTMFGLGGAVGSFVWAYIARKKGEFPCTIATLFLTLPFLVVYLALINHKAAIWLLFGAGFCTVSAYTLMITLSRHATGPTLGRRLGVMVGGTWALAYVIYMPMVLAAEYFHFGANVIINLSPWGYLFSGLFGILVMQKMRKKAFVKMSDQLAEKMD